MDKIFQELDYSDISSKNLNKQKKSSEINTKTRGGLTRLVSLIIIFIIAIFIIFGIISNSSTSIIYLTSKYNNFFTHQYK